MTTTTNHWAEFVAANRPEPSGPSEADLAYVAEYNAQGLDEQYGAHFADVEGMAAQVDIEDEQAEIAAWLATQTWSDFAVSLAESYQKFGELTQKQLVSARSMKAKVEAREQTKNAPVEADTDEVAELAEWLSEQTWSDFAQSLASFYQSRGYLSDKQLASAKSMKAKVDARNGGGSSKTERTAIDQDGIYVKDEVIYKVQIAKQGSGNLYAKRLVMEDGEMTWEYEGRKPLYILTEDDRMTEAQAAEFGRLYGICAACSRELTDETSIELGIGPICREKGIFA